MFIPRIPWKLHYYRFSQTSLRGVSVEIVSLQEKTIGIQLQPVRFAPFLESTSLNLLLCILPDTLTSNLSWFRPSRTLNSIQIVCYRAVCRDANSYAFAIVILKVNVLVNKHLTRRESEHSLNSFQNTSLLKGNFINGSDGTNCFA